MLRSPILILTLLLFALFSACENKKYTSDNPQPEDVSQDYSGALKSIDSFFTNSQTKFNGRVLIATDSLNTIIYNKSFGYSDIDLKIPYSHETANGVASLSKQFTAAAILKLSEEGKLSVKDRLTKFFPNLPNDKRSISIHQLLTHTAGLPLYSGKDKDVISKESLIEWFRKVPLDNIPGTRYSYSNPGYSLLAVIVEQLSKMNYEQFLRNRFFDANGLSATGYHYPKNPLAVCYDGDQRIGTSQELPWAPDGPYWNLRGNGGIISTPDDLFLWFKLLVKGNILNEENTREMFSRQSVDDHGGWYGYGWHIFEDDKGEWIEHAGSDGYKFTDLRYYKNRDVLLIITTNTFDYDEIKRFLQGFYNAFNLSNS